MADETEMMQEQMTQEEYNATIAPGAAMGNEYMKAALELAKMAHEATAMQQQMNIKAQESTTRSVTEILSLNHAKK